MRRILVFIISALLASCFAANGQSLLERLGERAKNAVENKLGEKVEGAVNKAVDRAAAKAENKMKGKKGNEAEAKENAAHQKEVQQGKPADKPVREIQDAYAKSDFVPGDEIFFEDTFENEKIGEFPLRWDLLDGYVETASLEGRKVLAFTDNGLGQVMPLMKDNKWNWLPEIFTLEFDLFVAPISDGGSTLDMQLCFGDRGASDYYNASSHVDFRYREDGSSNMAWSLR